MRSVGPGGAVLGAEGRDHQEAGAGNGVDDVLQERLAPRIEPVQVLHHDDEHPPVAPSPPQPVEGPEELTLAGLGVHRRQGPLRIGDTEEVEQEGQGVGQ